MEMNSNQDLKTTRNNKNSIFTGYFNDAKKLIELYNAIEGTDYPADTRVEINTLEDVLFRYRNNDLSFTLDGKLVILIEAQSSINENMPLRLLLYIGRVYEKIIDNKSIYNRKLVKIPRPEFIVLYSGRDDFPEQQSLKLSDAFTDVVTKELLELTVTVYNVNKGYNAGILEACEPLNEYAVFFARIRENESRGFSFGDAVVESIDYCIANGIMAKYLETHSSEVRNMLFTEYNAEDDKQVSFEEGREDKAEEVARDMKRDGMESALIAKYTGLSVEIIEKL